MLAGKGKDEWILVATQAGEGAPRLRAIDGDELLGSTPEVARLRPFLEAARLRLANQETREISSSSLDKRRMTDDPGDVLGFTMSLQWQGRHRRRGLATRPR